LLDWIAAGLIVRGHPNVIALTSFSCV